MPEERHDQLVRLVVRTAAEISKALTSQSRLSGPAANR
jgi:hypothetical protein